MHLKCHHLFLALLWCLPAVVWANPPGFLPQDLALKVWTKQQGLPDDAVTAVLQTRDGYLWIGTLGGLARFDGMRFMPVAPAAQTTNEPIRVTALCEDAAGRLWVGTQGDGLFCYTNEVLSPFEPKPGRLDGTINSIAEDGTGNLWLGTPSGLTVLEHNRLLRFTTTNGLANDFVSNVHVARSGMIWITTRGGMCQFTNGGLVPHPFQTESPGRNPESLGVYEDISSNLWAFGDTYLVNLTEGKHLNHFVVGDNISSLRIWSLCEGRYGELWIGTSGKGLFCFTDDKFLPVSLHDGGLTSDVRTLCEDHEGNLWLGTYGGGLVRLQPRNVRVLDATAGLPTQPAGGMAFDRQGQMFIGFEQAGLYAGTAERFDRVAGDATRSLQNLISSVAVAPDDCVWVGTPGAGLYCVERHRTTHYSTANGLADNLILSLVVDSKNTVWAGTASGNLSRITSDSVTNFGTQAGLPRQPITALLVTKHGELWVGQGDGGVFRGRAGGFKTIIESAVFGGKAIRAMQEDAAGRIWLGNAGGKLACVGPGRYWDWDLGLPPTDNGILGILLDEDGDLWLATGKAIHSIPQAEVAAALVQESSIHSRTVFETDSGSGAVARRGWPLAAKAQDGKLWFSTVAGVVMVDPRHLVLASTPLRALIESITVNGQILSCRDLPPVGTQAKPELAEARLSSNLRSIDIQFTAVDLSEPEKIIFRHRLDDSDPDWVEDGADRSVHYGHLAYGRYTFRVQAGTAAGWDHNEATFRFSVPAPWWRTVWAEGVYAFAAVVVVAGTARLVSNRRLRRRLAVLAQQQAMERERMRIAKDMHDDIGSKLTKISFMSERAKGELPVNDPVAHRLESIARTSRDLLKSLDEIVWAVNPHNDTLEHLAAYLGHYATEYLQDTAVECELHIPQNLPNHPLSAEARHNLFLAFEESLNNALKHGRATRIRVDMQARRHEFEISVEDNGCGFASEGVVSLNLGTTMVGGKRVGNGLRNLQQRLADVGGLCQIRSRMGQGTTVTLTVPLAAAG